jgi:decaprenylphospho-beta-D-ribofuranose 2-oxidase
VTPGARQLLTGWGGTAPTAAAVRRVSSRRDLDQALESAKAAGVVARGLGRSYADAAQCGGGTVLDMTGLDRVLAFDQERGRVRVEAGVSLDSLVRTILPAGWFLPVSPGTRQVTVGGALAADVHGKNHHRDGSWASFVPRCTLVTPAGTFECAPDVEPELFWATAGGMGLTGVVADLDLDLIPVETAFMRVDTERAADLDTCMALMDAGDDGYTYSVAWIDCLARGSSLGRSVLTRAEHAAFADLPRGADAAASRGTGPGPRLQVQFAPPVPLVRPPLVAAFNEAWYRKAPRRRRRSIEPLAGFFHPLDALGGWNRLYGRRGFLQYQFVVPFGACGTVGAVLERLSRARVAASLAVLKRFGPADPGMLSFPMPGWTLALDLPAGGPCLAELLDELDLLVAGAGGRVYLAKDGRLRPELLPVMYPRLSEWQSVRERADPAGILRSDLARRLGLVATDRRSLNAEEER